MYDDSMRSTNHMGNGPNNGMPSIGLFISMFFFSFSMFFFSFSLFFFTTNIYLGRAMPMIGMTGQIGKGISRDSRCISNPSKLDFSHYFFFYFTNQYFNIDHENNRSGGQEWKKKGLRHVVNVSRAPGIFFS